MSSSRAKGLNTAGKGLALTAAHCTRTGREGIPTEGSGIAAIAAPSAVMQNVLSKESC